MIVSSRSPASAAISLYGFFHKYRCALTRGCVDIFCKLPAAGIHVSQFAQNLVRALIKVFCHEDQAVDEFEYLNNDLKQKQLMAQFFGGMMGPVMGNMGQVSYAVIATVGGVLCALGRFSIGGLTVFANF